MFTRLALLTLTPLFTLTNLPKTALPVTLMVTTIFFITSGGDVDNIEGDAAKPRQLHEHQFFRSAIDRCNG
ncbi:MAG: hypothetical protein WBP29_02565 [Candidatus Zixiibacteriota bacterium]